MPILKAIPAGLSLLEFSGYLIMICDDLNSESRV
jgi:hypothetical protein